MPYLLTHKKTKKKWPVSIIQDDREKLPWELDEHKFKVTVQRLAVGDYTFEGFERSVCIEKKSGLREFIINISYLHRERFRRFLKKMSKIKHRIIIIEDDLSNIKSVLSKIKGTRLTEESVHHWLAEIMITYRTPVLFVGKKPRGIKKAVNAVLTSIMDNL